MSDIAAAWARVARLTEACADLRQRLEVVAIERDAAIASDRQASETCAEIASLENEIASLCVVGAAVRDAWKVTEAQCAGRGYCTCGGLIGAGHNDDQCDAWDEAEREAMAQLRAVLDRTGPPAEPAAAKEHYAAEVTALRAQVRALTENGISIHKAVAAERAAIVSFLDRRAADQSVAATAADTDSQRRVKQAQSRSTLGAAIAIERGEHHSGPPAEPDALPRPIGERGEHLGGDS